MNQKKNQDQKKKRKTPTKIQPEMIFGRLKVLYKCDYKYYGPNGKTATLWHVQCQCANKTEFDVLTNSLTSGNTKSCGCIVKEYAKTTLQEKGKEYRFKSKKNAVLNIFDNNFDLSHDYGIGFTKTGDKFYFDKQDYDKIKNYEWYTKISGSKEQKKKYVITIIEKETIYMHRFLLNLPSKKEDKRDVDHKNHNTLDNRRKNLRICEHYQNITSSKTRKDNTSGKKGVSWDNFREKWKASITYDKKTYFLGRFENFEEAVQVREKAEKRIHGEFNYLD